MRFLFLFIFHFILNNLLWSQDQPSNPCKDLSNIIETELKFNQIKIHQRTNRNTSNYDIRYQRLEWQVDPAIRYIKGIITTYFVPSTENFESINFDLRDNMQINEVLFHGKSLSWQQENDNLQIDLQEALAMGILDSISIDYEGVPASQGFGSFETGTHSGIPVLWTLSEPYGAKTWWPCKQDLNDKIDSVDIIIHTPPGNRAATAGVLIFEEQNSGGATYHWKHKYPIPAYLIGIAVTNYAQFSDFLVLPDGDSIEILNYVYPESVTAAQIQLEKTGEIMQLYNDLFGIYPFASEKYGHAQFGWGGGMEHQTMSFMGSFSYGLVAHELAHQWFGDKVTCSSWSDIWLNEGFATYLSGLVYEQLGSEQEWTNWKLARINSIVSQPGGSVWVKDTSLVSRIFDGRLSYNKGAYLLHMLRWTMGDEAFYQGVNSYLEDSVLSYGYATTEDLKKHLEIASNRDLSEFFADWFYGEGFPSYLIEWSQDGDKLYLNIRQSTSHPSVDFFEMSLPILVEGQGIDTLLRIDHLANGQDFRIDLPFEVAQLKFDPDLWIISRDNVVESVVTGRKEDDLQSVLRISPNPLHGDLYVELQNSGHTLNRIEIYDLKGTLIYRSSNNGKSRTIQTTDWRDGIYSVRIWSGNKSIVKKVVKY